MACGCLWNRNPRSAKDPGATVGQTQDNDLEKDEVLEKGQDRPLFVLGNNTVV
jgi:hypothetical protein